MKNIKRWYINVKGQGRKNRRESESKRVGERERRVREREWRCGGVREYERANERQRETREREEERRGTKRHIVGKETQFVAKPQNASGKDEGIPLYHTKKCLNASSLRRMLM